MGGAKPQRADERVVHVQATVNLSSYAVADFQTLDSISEDEWMASNLERCLSAQSFGSWMAHEPAVK